MKNEKVKNVIDIINYMDIKDKLRLAICIGSSKYNILYNKKDIYEMYDRKLSEIDVHYRKTHINFNKYHLVTFTMAKIIEMSEDEQNQVVLYLINNINIDEEKQKTVF